MKGAAGRRLLYGLAVLAYLLHNDFWLHGRETAFVMGLPVSLVYHLGLCAAASVLMLLLVKFAWPAHLRDEEQDRGT